VAKVHPTAGGGGQSMFSCCSQDDAITLDRHGSEAELPVASRPVIGSHLNDEGNRAPVHKAMAHLGCNLALGLTGFHRATGRLQSMADDPTQGHIAGLLIRSHRPSELTQLVGHELAIAESPIASHCPIMTNIGQQLFPSGMPGPFLELKAESIHLFI